MPCGVPRGLVGGEGAESHWGKDRDGVALQPCCWLGRDAPATGGWGWRTVYLESHLVGNELQRTECSGLGSCFLLRYRIILLHCN